MNAKLQEAIDIIEEAGGIVLLQDFEDPELAEYTEAEIKSREEAELKRLKELQEARSSARNKMHDMIGQEGCTLTAIEDMFLSEGLDLDEIEDAIHAMY